MNNFDLLRFVGFTPVNNIFDEFYLYKMKCTNVQSIITYIYFLYQDPCLVEAIYSEFISTYTYLSKCFFFHYIIECDC